MNNVHNQSIPADVLAQVNAKVLEAITLIKPYSVTLTADDRASVLKVGDKTFNFIEKCLSIPKQILSLFPII
jgi:hypothetical protein